MKRQSTDKLHIFLKELESSIHDRNMIAESVSSVHIGWQTEHSLLVLDAVIETLKTSDPSKFKKKFNFTKFVLFSLGRIPRGKGRAPKSVKPKELASKEKLDSLVSKVRDNVSDLATLDTDKFFKHPLFGNMRLNDSIRFLELHTEHHLKIIRAIQKAQ